MPRSTWIPDPACAIASAVGVVGDGWNLLVLRDVARGLTRFDQLADELRISRKVLAQRLAHLVEHEVLSREPYQERPTRYAYTLTPRGRALLPVLVGLQDWGDRWLLGAGALTATADEDAAEAHRVRGLVGTVVPGLTLDSTHGPRDVVAGPTVLFGYPATGIPGPLPDGWSAIPGAAGCTLENRLFHEGRADFRAAGVAVHGFSTQRVDEQRAFAAAEGIEHPLLSDVGLDLVAALRLPTFRAADAERVKRVVLAVDGDRIVRWVRYPVVDLPAAVSDALAAGALAAGRRAGARAGPARVRRPSR